MDEGTVSIYKEYANIIKVKKAEAHCYNVKTFPCICSINNGKLNGIALDYIDDEDVYIVDISYNKIFASSNVKEGSSAFKIGDIVCVNLSGQLTHDSEPSSGIVKIGVCLGNEGGAVLFKLRDF